MLVPAILIGCAAGPMVPNTAVAQDQQPAQQVPENLNDERAQLMYELMIAEIAFRRGYLDVAIEGYLRASKRTDDRRVAEQATKLAARGRQWELAQGSTRRCSARSVCQPG